MQIHFLSLEIKKMILYKITFKVILQKQDVFSLNKALSAFCFKNRTDVCQYESTFSKMDTKIHLPDLFRKDLHKFPPGFLSEFTKLCLILLQTNV